ncbi:hypothetical protein BCR39DRAFT_560592 [Naematelia encephala]|uniref:Uncharacterized protein n=1 Tax=Naematelia encephala TaxID=71784 RepID=A0A1Y2AV26_9TREE|nr:hypothetical protein BCR39DRAFT_560592 [Naematelia encephala]
MYRPRPDSRTSTIPSSPPSIWSMQAPGSSRTSWSDDAPTSHPRSETSEGVTVIGGRGDQEALLIDFGSDGDGERVREEMKPGDKLRILLRQMETEVRDTTPAKPEEMRPAWKERRARAISPLDEKEDSPPTPPMRIHNPYLNRKAPAERTSTPPPRIPSRAAALRASTSRSPAQPQPDPTPLEQFISHSSPRISDPSSSRSSTQSRKGKERASPEHAPRRPPRTPRRWSVEIAPEDSALFAQEAEGLEVRGEVELDLELSEDAPWGDTDESAEEVPSNSLRHEARLARISSQPKPSRPADTSIPELPEPEEVSADDESEINTLSSRRAALFRSSSKSASHSPGSKTARNSLSASISQLRQSDVTFAQDPVRVGVALLDSSRANINVATPPKHSISRSTDQLTTPHPPGWRAFTPARSKGAVRFSPAREADTSIHRIKVSPRKSPARVAATDADTSFTARLSRSITRVLPKPTSTLQAARSDLDRASLATAQAQERVETAQHQFIAALAQLQTGTAQMVKRGWRWGSWTWWLGMEALLIFGVFRVTLDYATSASYLAQLDPFALHVSSRAAANLGLTIPLPTAVSAFVVQHRGSANFFDLMESLEVWRYLEKLGIGVGMEGMQGVRMLGGVPS